MTDLVADRFKEALQALRHPEPSVSLEVPKEPVEKEEPIVEVIPAEDDDNELTVSQDESTVKRINLFQHPDAHPIVLDLILLREYGPDWLTWEPETLVLRIIQDFKTESVSELNQHKIQAAKTLHFVDTFWTNWEIFSICCATFNGLFPDFEYAFAPNVEQCAVAVDIANRLRDDVAWSDEIKKYLGVVFHHDNLFVPIEPLTFVPIDAPAIVDTESIKARWPGVRMSRKDPGESSIVDVQLRKMLIVHEYLEEDRALLRSQLPMVQHV